MPINVKILGNNVCTYRYVRDVNGFMIDIILVQRVIKIHVASN